MKNYEAYLFDWDGALAQTLKVWLSTYRDLYKEVGLDLSDQEIIRSFGNPNKILKVGVPVDKYEYFVSELNKRAHLGNAKAPLYPGVKELLDRLRKDGKTVVLLTSSIRKTITAVLDHHNLSGAFRLVVTADDISEHKPDPECIEFALQELQITKHNVLMLGDSDKDIGAANNAGIDSLLYYPKIHEIFYKYDDLIELKPTYVINEWDELA